MYIVVSEVVYIVVSELWPQRPNFIYKVIDLDIQVRYNDQVKLESVKTEGQFLHCSAKLFGVAFTAHRNW